MRDCEINSGKFRVRVWKIVGRGNRPWFCSRLSLISITITDHVHDGVRKITQEGLDSDCLTRMVYDFPASLSSREKDAEQSRTSIATARKLG